MRRKLVKQRGEMRGRRDQEKKKTIIEQQVDYPDFRNILNLRFCRFSPRSTKLSFIS